MEDESVDDGLDSAESSIRVPVHVAFTKLVLHRTSRAHKAVRIPVAGLLLLIGYVLLLPFALGQALLWAGFAFAPRFWSATAGRRRGAYDAPGEDDAGTDLAP